MATIVNLSTEQIFELGPSTTLGRARGNSIFLPDPLASGEHAEVRHLPGGGYLLIDLGSSNGTYVGGRRVTEQMLLSGDEIVIGGTRLLFEEDKTEETGDISALHVVAQPMDDDFSFSGTDPRYFPKANAIGDTRKLRLTYDKLRAAYHLNRIPANIDNLDGMLEYIAQTSLQALPADRVMILLLNERSGRPVPRLARKRGGAEEPIIISSTVVNQVLSNKEGLISNDTSDDIDLASARSVNTEGIRSVMCVPMLHAHECMGLIYLDSLMATHVFVEDDLQVLTAVGRQAAVALKNVRLRHRMQSEAISRVKLQRFLSPNVADQIVAGKLKLQDRGELAPVTVMFADVRGFTQLCEELDPAEIVSLLNEHFENLVEALFKHGGTLDKYVGDALMGLFGAPAPLPNAELAAIRAALEMLEVTARFAREQHAQGRQPLRIGIGLHTGMAVCGAMGSSKARSYTAIGDTVNTSSRLCDLAKPGELVISEATMRSVRDLIEAEELPATKVKGKRDPLRLFSVKGLR